MSSSSFPELLSTLLGWTYTLLWSLSFYPQTLTNFSRRSSSGFSTDFAYLNPLGFACYSASQLGLLLHAGVRQQYREGHNGHNPTVRWNDVAFALHAVAIASVTLGQKWVYGGREQREEEERKRLQRDEPITGEEDGTTTTTNSVAPSPTTVGGSGRFPSRLGFITLLTLLTLILLGLLACSTHLFSLGALDFVNLLAGIKLYITLTKWIPQVALNARRRCTVGFNVHGVTLDAAGGILSTAQLVIDAKWIQGDWSGVTGNPGKLGIALISFCFDMVLITQHYVLYPAHKQQHQSRDSVEDGVNGEENGGRASERTPLLRD